MGCFVRGSLALLKITNVHVVNTKELDIKGLFAIDVVLRLQKRKSEETELVILILLCQLHIYGILSLYQIK